MRLTTFLSTSVLAVSGVVRGFDIDTIPSTLYTGAEFNIGFSQPPGDASLIVESTVDGSTTVITGKTTKRYLILSLRFLLNPSIVARNETEANFINA